MIAAPETGPWRLWWTSRHLSSETPGIAVGGITSNASRIWPSLRLVLDLQFDTRFWLWILPIALVAALLGLGLAGVVRETAALYLLTCLFCTIGFTWILVSQPGIALTTRGSDTPIPRAVGSVVLLSTVLAALLIEPLLARRPEPLVERPRGLEASGAGAAP